MDPTQLALEANLADNPDDLVAHAAYADWLIENDDSRGEYIRMLIELENPALVTKVRRRAMRMLAKYAKEHEAEWLGPLMEFVNSDWRYGHAMSAHISIKLHLGWIQSMFLDFPEPRLWEAVAQSPMSRLTRKLIVLQNDESVSHDQAAWVVHLSQFPNLRWLDVELPEFADSGVNRLLAMGVLSQLTALRLPRCNITDDGALALAAEPHIRKLCKLYLSGNSISPVGRAIMAEVGFDIGPQQAIHTNVDDRNLT